MAETPVVVADRFVDAWRDLVSRLPGAGRGASAAIRDVGATAEAARRATVAAFGREASQLSRRAAALAGQIRPRAAPPVASKPSVSSRAAPFAGYAAAALAAVAAYALVQAAAGGRSESEAGKAADSTPAGNAARALEPGKGRDAVTPWQIPLSGWKDILWRTWGQIGEDRLLAIAAGVVFYGLLAFFPAVTALVSSYGLFASPASIAEHLGVLNDVLPAGAYSIVSEQIQRVVSASDGKLGLSFVVGLGLAIWSANAGMKAVIDALNVVYEEDEKRGFVKLNAVSLAFTAGALLAVLVGIGAVVALPAVTVAVGLGAPAENVAAMVSFARWPVLFALLVMALGVFYRFGPSRTQPRWHWISVGAIAAAALWIAGSAGLSFYISRFGDYDATYGSLGAAIGLMMWMWLSAIVVLFGAELNSEIEHQTAADSTVGLDKPLGARGAMMADSVGPSAP